MKKIAHISNLHFGTEDKQIAEALFEDITVSKPNVIVVSGDLTQRARTKQFENAKKYLDRFPFPKIVVPGNHDIPLFDIFKRFLAPLNRYKKIISDDLSPLYNDGELAVYGINTARSLTWKEGRISVKQMKDLEKVWDGMNFIEKKTSSYKKKGNAWIVDKKRALRHHGSQQGNKPL